MSKSDSSCPIPLTGIRIREEGQMLEKKNASILSWAIEEPKLPVILVIPFILSDPFSVGNSLIQPRVPVSVNQFLLGTTDSGDTCFLRNGC